MDVRSSSPGGIPRKSGDISEEKRIEEEKVTHKNIDSSSINTITTVGDHVLGSEEPATAPLSNLIHTAINITKDTTPGVVGNLAEKLLEAGIENKTGFIAQVLPGAFGAGVRGVVSQQLSQSEEEISIAFYNSALKLMNEEKQKAEKDLDQYLQQLEEGARKADFQLHDVAQRMKALCFDQVPAEQAFPQEYIKQCYQVLGSWMGYEFPKEFGQKEYEQWCKELDQAVSNQQEVYEMLRGDYQEEIQKDWGHLEETQSKLAAPLEKEIQSISSHPQSNPLAKMFTEFTRSTAIGSLGVVANLCVLDKLAKQGPLPFILGMTVLNTCLSALETTTHSSAKLGQVEKQEGQIQFSAHRSLEFLKRLENSLGSGGLALLASNLIPGSRLCKLITAAIIIPFSETMIEHFNPTSTSLSEREKEFRQKLAQEIVSQHPQVFITPEFEQTLQKESRETLLEIVKTIPDEKIVERLNREIDEYYSVQSQSTHPKKTEEVHQEQVAASSKSSKDELQDEMGLLIFEIIVLGMLKACFNGGSSHTEEKEGRLLEVEKGEGETAPKEPPTTTTEPRATTPTTEPRATTPAFNEPPSTAKEPVSQISSEAEKQFSKEAEETREILEQTAQAVIEQQKLDAKTTMRMVRFQANQIFNSEIEIDTSKFSSRNTPEQTEISKRFAELREKNHRINELFGGIDTSTFSAQQMRDFRALHNEYLKALNESHRELKADLKNKAREAKLGQAPQKKSEPEERQEEMSWWEQGLQSVESMINLFTQQGSDMPRSIQNKTPMLENIKHDQQNRLLKTSNKTSRIYKNNNIYIPPRTTPTPRIPPTPRITVPEFRIPRIGKWG
jgi:uncharacterized membrane protein YeaQ/YmgE (transglycosylase-associated protein family)